MNIVMFFNKSLNAGFRLFNVIEPYIDKDQIDIFRSIDDFSFKMLQPLPSQVIIIVLPANLKELFYLISINDLFTGRSLILILPDRDKETTKVGFKLYPRFVSYSDSNFSDVGMVFAKLRLYLEWKYRNLIMT